MSEVVTNSEIVPTPFPLNDVKLKRGGAPKGNENRTVHGVNSLARTGRVPLSVKGGHNIRRRLRKLAREVSAEFTRIHEREPTLAELALMHSLSRHEARAALLEARLANEGTGLTIPEFAAVLGQIGAATDSRDRVMAKLELDLKPEDDPWWGMPGEVGDG